MCVYVEWGVTVLSRVFREYLTEKLPSEKTSRCCWSKRFGNLQEELSQQKEQHKQRPQGRRVGQIHLRKWKNTGWSRKIERIIDYGGAQQGQRDLLDYLRYPRERWWWVGPECYYGGRETYSNSEYILRVEAIEFVDRSNVRKSNQGMTPRF